MKEVKEIKDYGRVKIEFIQNPNWDSDIVSPMMQSLGISVGKVVEISDYDGVETTFRSTIGLKIHSKPTQDKEYLPLTEERMRDYDSNEESDDLFTLEVIYVVFFTLNNDLLDSKSDEQVTVIQQDLIEYMQMAFRRDVEYIASDSKFNGDNFPLQLTRN